MNGQAAREVRTKAMAGAISSMANADLALQHQKRTLEAFANRLTHFQTEQQVMDRRMCRLQDFQDMSFSERLRWLFFGSQ